MRLGDLLIVISSSHHRSQGMHINELSIDYVVARSVGYCT